MHDFADIYDFLSFKGRNGSIPHCAQYSYFLILKLHLQVTL